MEECASCHRPRNEVKKLVEFSPNLHICNRCIENAHLSLEQEKVDAAKKDPGKPQPLQKPKEIKAWLDGYVVSQEGSKRDVAVAVYNHYKRREAILSGRKLDVEIQKSNILLMGPTGTGKTQLARSVARLLRVPFYVGDATKLTMSGYVGDDVESLLQGLVAACDGDLDQAQWGIVFLDEADKLARKSGRSASGFRDVTGEGVQQSLLKLVEGTKIQLPKGMNQIMAAGPGAPASDAIDTENILFILAGSFAGIEDIVLDRVNKSAKMGFGSTSRKDLSTGDVYAAVEEADILEFGIIPELLGRIPIHTSTMPLTEDEMVRILTEPKDAIIRQFQALFAMDNIDLLFDQEALLAIGREAISRPTGARALRSIVERILKNYAYECPSDPTVRSVRISEAVVTGKGEAIIVRDPPQPEPAPKVAATA